MHTDVFIEVGGVVESDALEAFQASRKFVDLGEASTALLLNADLYFTDPSALKLNALGNDLLLEPVAHP